MRSGSSLQHGRQSVGWRCRLGPATVSAPRSCFTPRSHNNEREISSQTAANASPGLDPQPGGLARGRQVPGRGRTPGASKPSQRSDARPPPDVQGYTTQQLAYVGDSIWSLHVRSRALVPPKNFTAYRTAAERHVSAAKQALYLDILRGRARAPSAPSSGPRAAPATGRPPPAGPALLTPEEVHITSWAEGARGLGFRGKYTAAGGQQDTYRKATAFEALLGYLSLTDEARLQELLQLLEPHLQAVDAAAGSKG